MNISNFPVVLAVVVFPACLFLTHLQRAYADDCTSARLSNGVFGKAIRVTNYAHAVARAVATGVGNVPLDNPSGARSGEES